MKTNTARKYKSVATEQLMKEITPLEKSKALNKMLLAAKIEDLMLARGWNKSTFAERVGKAPSEITKWLSGTHNFTNDTLTEISAILGVSIAELYDKKQDRADLPTSLLSIRA